LTQRLLARTRKQLGLALRVLVTAAALAYVVHRVPLGQVKVAIAAASVPLILLGCGAQLVVRAVNALRVRIIAKAQGAPLSYRAILTTMFTTAFYGLMLPGSVGGGAATLVKYLGHGATPAAALASMIVNRLLDTGATLTLGLAFWGFAHYDPATGGAKDLAVLLLVVGPLLFLAFHLLLFGRPRVLRRIRTASQRFGLEHRGPVAKGIARVIDQCATAGNLSAADAISVCALSLLKVVLAVAVAYAFAAACGLELSFANVGWMNAIVTLLVLLPISFAGLGVREGTLVLLGARYGVAAPLALSWSLLQFAGLLFVAAIGACIEAWSFLRGRRR
jgi:glycosyltransferase 2 family protein